MLWLYPVRYSNTRIESKQSRYTSKIGIRKLELIKEKGNARCSLNDCSQCNDAREQINVNPVEVRASWDHMHAWRFQDNKEWHFTEK